MKIDWNGFHLWGDIARKQEIPVENVQEQFANVIMQQGQGIAAYDLALKVYNDLGGTEYNEKETQMILKLMDTMPAMWAAALKAVIQ